MPTGDESFRCAVNLLPGCAGRRWFDLRSSQMSWEMDLLTGKKAFNLFIMKIIDVIMVYCDIMIPSDDTEVFTFQID